MKGAHAAGLALAFLLALTPGSLAHAATLSFSSITLSSSNASTTLAKAGDVIRLHITSPEEIYILTDPVRSVASSTIAGHDTNVQCSNDHYNHTGDCSVAYTMQSDDPDGVIPFFFSTVASNGNDWGQATTTTDGSIVEFDNTFPSIRVNNPDPVGYAVTKFVSATVTEAHPFSFQDATTTGGCNTPGIVFSDYVSGSDIPFISEADDDTKVCFEATDALGHTTQVLSNALAHIGTDPNPAPVVTSATITLTGGNTTNVVLGDTFTDPGATALGEPGDVDLTSSIRKSGDAVNASQLGTYHIHYTVFDSGGAPLAEEVRTVVVQDPYAPVITLNGDASMTLTEGDTFTDPGATANDPQDGNVPVTVSGSVDTARAGTYTLTYSATDSSNNTSTATRTVTVEAKPVHHSSGGGGGHSGSSVVATSTPSGGEVLGAATYNFLADLKVGSTGADVTALQQILIAGGYLAVPVPTGYFGLGTQAAVEAYQAAHGIAPASGYVGALTRASLSTGLIQGSGTVIDRPALLLQIAELLKQVAELQAELARMQQ